MNPEIQAFIQEQVNNDLSQVSLLLSKYPDWPKEYILNQINGRQKAKAKFPSLAVNVFTFPSPRAIEQASSETTAQFKAQLVSGHRLLDLSGGMGMDSLYFARKFEQVDYVEANAALVETFAQNCKQMDRHNIHCHHSSAEDFLSAHSKTYDVIYIDPDRRNAKGRQFQIEDCSPNLNLLFDDLWTRTSTVLIKLSPLLDIKAALKQLPFCKSVIVLAVKNDCKELLFLLEKDHREEPQIQCVNLNGKTEERFEFQFSGEQNAEANYGETDVYLYDPNVAILKAGAFKSIATAFNLKKIASNTHLYTSNVLIENFPGRIFKVLRPVQLKKEKIKQANVIVKNYPLSAQQVKSKYKIQEGGKEFLIGFRDRKNKSLVWMCKRAR